MERGKDPFQEVLVCRKGKRWVISLSLGDQITTALATSVLPVCSEENS